MPGRAHSRRSGFVNATDLHSIDKSRLRRRRGRLHLRELMSLEEAVRTYLGL
jgi:mRNA-degrading endonuclease toxin of MazEF toxin-antitoxin module